MRVNELAIIDHIEEDFGFLRDDEDSKVWTDETDDDTVTITVYDNSVVITYHGYDDITEKFSWSEFMCVNYIGIEKTLVIGQS